MNMSQIEWKKGGYGTTPYIRLSENNRQLYLSSGAVRLMGHPERVAIGVDKEQKIVAFREDKEGYKLGGENKNTAMISIMSIEKDLDEIGMDKETKYELKLAETDSEKIYYAEI